MKRILCILLVAVMLFALAACGTAETASPATDSAPAGDTAAKSSPAGEESSVKDTLTLAISAEPNHLNPKGIPEAADEQVMPNIMETLLTIDADGNLVGMLAESWEYESDTNIIFHLREGVKFHNGEEMTAEDALYSLYLTSQAFIINGNVADVDFDASEVIDDYTFRLVLTQPSYADLFYLTWVTTSIVCKSAWEEMGEDAYSTAPIGTGPYKFVSWDADGTITLEAFDEYWDADNAAHIKNLIFTVIEDANARAIAVETGTVDFAYYVATADLPALEGTDGITILTGPSLTLQEILINGQNTEVEALHDERVRLALIKALDRDALIQAIYDGYGIVANTLLVESTFGYDPSYGEAAYGYDPDAAKELLAEAGYADGFSFSFMIYDDTTVITLAEAMRNMWAECGIDCEIEVLEMGSFMNYFDASEWDMCYNFIGITTGDADDGLSMMLRGGKNNHYDDPEINELIDAQHFENDPETRLGIISDLQRVITEKSYIVSLFNLDDIFVYNSALDGFVATEWILYRDLAGVYWTE